MGKSTTAAFFRRFGVPVHDADATVHRLMGPKGQAVPKILARFADCGSWEGGIDRQKLGSLVFGDAAALKSLEAILHPLVRQAEQQFINRQRQRRVPLVVLDIPLLFETNGQKRCDRVVVVSASKVIQRNRVLRRKGMTKDKFNAILKKQYPDAAKRRAADYVIYSGLGRGAAVRQVKKILNDLKALDSYA